MKIVSYLLPFMLLFGCEARQPKERRLQLAFNQKIRGLDPRTASNMPEPVVLNMLFDGLVRRGVDGKIYPSVAKSYDTSADQQRITFYLRDSYWTDGTPVTAYDFVYAWKKCIDPKSVGPHSFYFYCIKNAKKCSLGELPLEEVGIRALDAHTLEVELEYFVPYYEDLFTDPIFYPIPKHLDEQGIDWALKTDETFVSNGPFQLKKWSCSGDLALEKNREYWDCSHISIPGIDIAVIDDHMTTRFLYEKGEIDYLGRPLNNLPPEMMRELRQNPTFSVVDVARITCFFINNAQFPFSNQKIRQAFSYAIDRDHIATYLLDGRMLPARSLIPPCFGVEPRDYFKDGDLERARELFREGMDELGLTAENFPKVTFKYSSSGEWSHWVAQVVQQVWQNAFSIPIALERTEWTVHANAITQGDYQIGLIGKFTLACDPLFMLEMFKFKESLVNTTNWESPLYQELLDRALYEKDPSKRQDLLLQAEACFMEEMPLIPLYFGRIEYVKNPAIEGIIVSSSQNIDFKFARFIS